MFDSFEILFQIMVSSLSFSIIFSATAAATTTSLLEAVFYAN
jgi:hypothetical protein